VSAGALHPVEAARLLRLVAREAQADPEASVAAVWARADQSLWADDPEGVAS
jgi:hypothetical protein